MSCLAHVVPAFDLDFCLSMISCSCSCIPVSRVVTQYSMTPSYTFFLASGVYKEKDVTSRGPKPGKGSTALRSRAVGFGPGDTLPRRSPRDHNQPLLKLNTFFAKEVVKQPSYFVHPSTDPISASENQPWSFLIEIFLRLVMIRCISSMNMSCYIRHQKCQDNRVHQMDSCVMIDAWNNHGTQWLRYDN